MCGIKNRLNKYKEVLDRISSYDVIRLKETKHDNADNITIPGYVLYAKNRHTLSKTRSGGILVAVRDNIVKYVHVIRTDCKYVSWF